MTSLLFTTPKSMTFLIRSYLRGVSMEFVFVSRFGDFYFFAENSASARIFANTLAEQLNISDYWLFDTGVRL